MKTHNKHVYIMRGIPGSGKSTWVNSQCEQLNNVGYDGRIFVVSADHYFMKSGTYKFEITELGKAHKECQQKFMDAIGHKCDSTVFIDNTNLTLREMNIYINVCQDLDIKFCIVDVSCNLNTAISRNLHGVPAEHILKMETKKNDIEIPESWEVIRVNNV